MQKRFALLLLCLCLLSCADEQQKAGKMDKMDWLLGFWETENSGGSVTESWLRNTDSTFAGVGKFKDSTGRVLSTEEITIVLRNDKLLYIPTVSNQNNGMPIVFAEVQFADTVVVFENKEHDFPQRIAYQKLTDSTILAYIEGDIEGENQRIEFSYSKR